jgi:hypothetical protein
MRIIEPARLSTYSQIGITQILGLILFATSVAAQPVAPPEFSHPAQTYMSPFQLSFEVPEGTTVRYTVDGNVPTTSSTAYPAGSTISISGTVMVRARAFREGYEPSETITRTYIRLGWDVEYFTSNLPLVVVNQLGNVMHPEGVHRSTVSFTVIDRGSDGRTRLLTDDLHLQSRSESNYRGTSSLSFPKKQFGVRLIDDEDGSRNEAILGLPSENNWIMSAPWDDRTLIRNAVAYRVSSDMGRYAPRTRFVELFLHDGSGPVTSSHYHGVYMLVERIKWDDNRVNIQKMTPEDNSEPEITGGYIINFEHGREWHIESTTRRTRFALVRPQVEDITHQQRMWIEDYIGGLESALFGSSFRDPQAGYAAYLDPESFVDHHLITETFKEMDGYRLSTFLHKDRGGRMIMGPVWDYNLSLGNYTTTEGWNGHDPTGWYHTYVPESAYLNGWYNRLFQDPDFQERYRERWWELRHGAFATDHIVNMIHRFVDELGEAVDRNFDRWPILGEDVWQWSREGFDTYEEEIDYMVDWIETRLAWIDSQMGEPPASIQSNLRYFWHFGSDIPNNTPLESLDATFALSSPAQIRFESALAGYPFDESHSSWRKASMERRNNPTDLNYRSEGNQGRPYDAGSMRGLQVKQPFTGDGGENALIFDVPTSGLENVVFRFAALDEGAADALLIDYATQPGEIWTNAGLETPRLALSGEYQLFEVNFGEVTGAADNPDFKIRIRFEGSDMTADRGDRVTFNNISLDTLSSKVSTSLEDGEGVSISAFKLNQNYPNPFNPSTTISFAVPVRTPVTLTVYNSVGQRVAVLVDEAINAGRHSVSFDASQLASGLYLYLIQAGDFRETRRMVLVK